jgi:hypothetical protein
MPSKTLAGKDRKQLAQLASTAGSYFCHLKVVANLSDSWGLAITLSDIDQCLRTNARVGKKIIGEISMVLQRAADVFSRPDVQRIPFALRSGSMADRLREAVAKLKKYR